MSDWFRDYREETWRFAMGQEDDDETSAATQIAAKDAQIAALHASRDEWTNAAVQRGLELEELRAEIAALQCDLRLAISARDYANDMLDKERARIAELREALTDIAIYGCGMLSQPAAMNGPEETWLKMRIHEYERRARAALEPTADSCR